MKKILIAFVILLIICVSFIPVVTMKMAEAAFDKPDEKSSQKALKMAINIDMRLSWYGKALKTAEKAAIYFPESENIGFYIYSAAFCAEREKNDEAAIYWYDRFVKIFPKNPLAREAKSNILKLKSRKG